MWYCKLPYITLPCKSYIVIETLCRPPSSRVTISHNASVDSALYLRSACQHLITVKAFLSTRPHTHCCCSSVQLTIQMCLSFFASYDYAALTSLCLCSVGFICWHEGEHSLFSARFFLKMSTNLWATGGKSQFNYRCCNQCCLLCLPQLNTRLCLLQSALMSKVRRLLLLYAWEVISLLFVSFSPQVVLVFALSIGALGIYFIDSSE